MAPFDLRKEVVAMVHRAIDSTKHYNGSEYDLNRHNWEQITTDRIIAAVMQSLPEPVDIKAKYETGPDNGIFVNVGNDNSPESNEQQLDYLASYQTDQGFNKFYFDYSNYLRGLYTIPEPVVQSEHEQSERFHGESDEDSNNKEPSKVR